MSSVVPPRSVGEPIAVWRSGKPSLGTRRESTVVIAYLVTLDAAKGWLNGEPTLNSSIRDGAGQRFLQAHWGLHLKAGEKRLLLKMGWAFFS